MKKIRNYTGMAVLFALLFTSCSKEEEALPDQNSQMATLSFATVLNDLVANEATLKQAIEEIPECSDGVPVFVEVVLSGPTEVGTVADPVAVAISPTPGDYDGDGEEEYFTQESAALELEPGTYTLEFFAVYDGDPDTDGDLLWVAPRKEGSLSGLVNTALPYDIELGAGVKKYVDIDVLCFDDRIVNEYGYLFFELEETEVFEFCFFANYCNPDGRHFPAAYSVDVWLGTDNTGTMLYSDLENTVSSAGDDPSASPLCIALPNLGEFADDEEYIYYEVTLMDWTDVYGEVETNVISGTLSRSDIMANFDGEDNIDYEHLRFGCDDDGNGDGDGDDDGEEPQDQDVDDDNVPDSEDNCPEMANPDQSDMDNDNIGDICDSDKDGDDVPNGTDNCPEMANPNQGDMDNDNIGDVCDSDKDGDGVPNETDDCPAEAGVEENNGCPVDPGDGGEEPCEISAPAAECDVAYLEGNTGFVAVGNNLPLWMEVDGETIGTIEVDIDEEGNLTIGSELTVESEVLYSAYQIWVSSSSSGAEVISKCGTVDNSGTLLVEFGDINASYPYYVRIEANVCPANAE